VTCAENPEQALPLIKNAEFDLLILDGSPGISGDRLCQQIREFDSKTPVLFYSGAAFPEDKERALAAGAQGYLTKPAPPDELIAEVRRIIESQNCADSHGA